MPWKKKSTTDILKALRREMSLCKPPLAAYIIPSEDAHMSEYVAECDKRRSFVSGFTGSRGLAVVTREKAALWTDGRYFLQASEEMDENWQLMREGMKDVKSPHEWLSAVLYESELKAVGIDAWLISVDEFSKLKRNLASHGLQLVTVKENLIDTVRSSDRPARPAEAVWIMDQKYCGKSWQDKVLELQKSLKEQHCTHLVISALDDIAWLFNLRGADISFNKFFFAFAVVSLNSATLFISAKQVTTDIRGHLQPTQSAPGVDIVATSDIYAAISEYLSQLSSKNDEENSKFWVPDTGCQHLASIFAEEQRYHEPSPISLMKATKNPVEIEGFRSAHLKDGVAHCCFLTWIEKEIRSRNITEIEAADHFEKLRREQPDYIDLSFETISAVDSNAAMCHYAPSEDNNGVITSKSIYLVDSGGHYKDGTTDVTRTVHFGEPSSFQKEAFTAVLKGHIALATLAFPEDTNGYRLDCIARQALYNLGLDYMHGTGHGVGHCLSVHEGPAGFHFRPSPSSAGVKEGMILTIEPGYYEDNQFGIRIENVCVIVQAETKYHFKKKFLGFKPLTLVPIQRKLIDTSMLSSAEVDWINKYHERCLREVGELVPNDVRAWLYEQCKPI